MPEDNFLSEQQIPARSFVNMMNEAPAEKVGSRPEPLPDGAGVSNQLKIWFLAFTRFHKIPVFRRVWLYVAVMAAYAFVVDYVLGLHLFAQGLKEIAGAIGFSSVILGLLLVFRTNAAYDRWWEGRKLWGQLVNDSRNLCMKVNSLVKVSYDEKIRFGNLVISFAYALKHHLRDTIPSAPLPGFETVPSMSDVHMPMYVSAKMYDRLSKWMERNQIDDFTRLQLDPHLRAFMDICGACERIKKTPLAVSYRAFIRQGITLNLAAVPWYMPPDVAFFYCMPVMLICAYFLIGLELIAEEVEEPFGKDGDDLPLDTIADGIRNSIAEVFDFKGKQQAQFTRSFKVVQHDPLNLNQPKP